MEINGQFHIPTALLSGKDPPIPICVWDRMGLRAEERSASPYLESDLCPSLYPIILLWVSYQQTRSKARHWLQVALCVRSHFTYLKLNGCCTTQGIRLVSWRYNFCWSNMRLNTKYNDSSYQNQRISTVTKWRVTYSNV
jgi:hypothetical protein